MTITEHDPGNFRYGATCFGVERSDDLVYIQITCLTAPARRQPALRFEGSAAQRSAGEALPAPR